ncbi:MAG: MoxR family ATPase [Spirochaetales bacterium]|nr:MoxR family ATPase [Spirochaetales bacterium]
MNQTTSMSVENAAQAMRNVAAEVGKAFIGQKNLVDSAMIALLAGGHLLVEGIPGLGKTLLVRALARALGGDSTRVQFTPDLMPSDISGHVMFDSKNDTFVTKKGPIFTNLLVADEINRAPAKTQAALFEAMQEFQVSLDGVTHALPRPFMTLATQNPFEHEGTYPLPDAQKDRFLMKIVLDYPPADEESAMVGMVIASGTGAELITDAVHTVLDPAGFMAIQAAASGVRVDPAIVDYAVRIVAATRHDSSLATGAGPRGSLSLVRAARAKALLDGRDFTLPDDIKAVTVPVLRHRVTLSPESEVDGITESKIIDMVLSKVEAPRS